MIYKRITAKVMGYAAGITFMLAMGSCSQYLDINKDPNNPLDAPIDQILLGATVNVGFTGGSDLFRYSALIIQQLSGQSAGTQTVDYERYNIQGSDENNLWNSLFTNTLINLNGVIDKAGKSNLPAYSGVAKILKAYTYQLIVDAFGKAPYTQALQTTANTSPVFDDGAAIYTSLFALIDDGIKDINTTSVKNPDATSTAIYPGAWATSKVKWEKFANALKMRMYLHYSKKDKAFAVKGISDLVSNAATKLMSANTDNFEMAFVNAPNNQNATDQFERQRPNYLFPNATLVNLMNTKVDPRRATYFTSFPFTFNTPTSTYKGAMAGDPVSIKYSRIHIFLRGDTIKTVTPNADGSIQATGTKAYDYTGAAPTRMLTFAEYNFIRAEAALYGAPGDPQVFFQAGITASMQNAGVAKAAIDAYILANGTLKGADSDKLKQIIEEKFVANFGVIMEPWTDWRRTGFPTLTPVPNAVTADIPRSLYYPQSEIDVNKNAPAQKANILERVFWDM